MAGERFLNDDECSWLVDVVAVESVFQRLVVQYTTPADDSVILRIEDAKENLGENEVREALLAKADYFISIGDKVCHGRMT